MVVNSEDITVTESKGESEVAINSFLHNGLEVKRHHCKDCGTGLWFSADSMPGIYLLKPGTFEDTTWFKPVAHLWLQSSQAWVVLDSSVAKYDTQPEMSELIELWAHNSTA